MSLQTLQAPAPVGQLFCWVLHYGTYLAQHWDDERSVNRYHCASDGRGFFVEVGSDDGSGPAVVPRNFVEAGPLEGYTQGGQLPPE